MGVALVIGSAVSFGTLGVFGKLAYRVGLTTPQLLSYRFGLAALLLWAAAVVMRQGLPSRRNLAGLVIMGGAGYVAQSASYFNALHYIPASTTALLLYTYPVVVTVLAAVLFGESLGRMKLGALGLSALGTVLVVQAQLHAAPPIGIILGLGSAAFYSGYILFGSRLLPGLPPVSSTAVIMTSAAVVWSLYAGINGQLWGAVAEALVAAYALLSAGGKLSSYRPFTDVDGKDIIIDLAGGFKDIYVQVKCALGTDRNGRIGGLVRLHRDHVPSSPKFVYIFCVLDRRRMELARIWVVPSANFLQASIPDIVAKGNDAVQFGVS